jgi:CDGSH-type Zn-finger protein
MPAKITISPNGSAKIEGEFTIVDKDGNAYNTGGKPAVFICRCGQTKNTPFCDGSHKTCGFVGPSEAR